ncbi:MAG: hypothetical protein AABW67_03270 [Nanoarchaeota archaeon]
MEKQSLSERIQDANNNYARNIQALEIVAEEIKNRLSANYPNDYKSLRVCPMGSGGGIDSFELIERVPVTDPGFFRRTLHLTKTEVRLLNVYRIYRYGNSGKIGVSILGLVKDDVKNNQIEETCKKIDYQDNKKFIEFYSSNGELINK